MSNFLTNFFAILGLSFGVMGLLVLGLGWFSSIFKVLVFGLDGIQLVAVMVVLLAMCLICILVLLLQI